MDTALPQLFFFYGTLIAGSDNMAARAAHGRLHLIGMASVTGALWAIPDAAGWYPALVAGQGRSRGVLYAATAGFGAEDLARLDAWEDYRADQPEQSLYVRQEMPVTQMAGVTLPAQVYRYNQPLPMGARPVPQGDFQAWLNTTGHTAYAP